MGLGVVCGLAGVILSNRLIFWMHRLSEGHFSAPFGQTFPARTMRYASM
jgi:hypothetical protein